MATNKSNFCSSEKVIIWLILAVILFLVFLVVKPLLKTIISSVLLAYIFYPMYIFLINQKKIKLSKKLSALLVILAIVMMIILPVLFLLLLITLNKEIIVRFFETILPTLNNYLGNYLHYFDNDFFRMIGVQVNLKPLISAASAELLKIIQILITSVPNFILNSLVALMVVYYLLRKANEVMPFVSKLLPLSKKHLGLIIKRFDAFTHGLLASQFVIAIVQSILMFIALLILRNKYTLFLTILTFILALIPFMGAFLVWGFLAVTLFIKTTQGGPLWQPVFMLLYGSLVISLVDNFIRPKILADSANINPAIVLVGLIGGFIAFGVPGIFFGPIILTLLDLALDLYKQVK